MADLIKKGASPCVTGERAVRIAEHLKHDRNATVENKFSTNDALQKATVKYSHKRIREYENKVDVEQYEDNIDNPLLAPARKDKKKRELLQDKNKANISLNH